MNFYEALKILDLDSNYSEEELNKKYHALAKKHHPDALTNKSAEEKKAAENKMKKINLAYDTLKKDRKKSYSNRQSNNNDKQSGNKSNNSNNDNDNGWEFSYWNNILNIIKSYNDANITKKPEFASVASSFKSFFSNYYLNIVMTVTKNEVDKLFREFKNGVRDWYIKLKDIYFKEHNIPRDISFTINENRSFDEFYESLTNFKHGYDNVIKEIDYIINPYKLYTDYEVAKKDIEKLREETIKNVCRTYNNKDYFYQCLRTNLDNLFKYYSTNIALYTELEEIIKNNNLPFQRRIEELRENVNSPLFYLYYIQLKLDVNNLLDYQNHEREIVDIENNLTQKYNEAVKNLKDEEEKKELYFFYKSIVHYLRTQKDVSFQSLKLLNEIDFNNYEKVFKIHDNIDNNLITNKKVDIYINISTQDVIASRHIKIDDEEYDMLSNNGENIICETYNNMDNNFISLDEFMTESYKDFITFDWYGEPCIGLYHYNGLLLCVYKGHLQFLNYPMITNVEWYPDHKFSMFQSKDYVRSLLINTCYSEIEKFKTNNNNLKK